MALPPPPTSSEATPRAVIPPFEPDSETQANQLTSAQMIGRSLGITVISAVPAVVAGVVPVVAFVVALSTNSGPDNDEFTFDDMAFFAVGAFLLLLASSVVFVLTARWGIRRWIPTSQRGASWLIVLVPLCVAIWGILA